MSKTGGGRGTNQYRIRGTAKVPTPPTTLPTPEPSHYVQLARTIHVIQELYPEARYLSFSGTWRDIAKSDWWWSFDSISTDDGTTLAMAASVDYGTWKEIPSLIPLIDIGNDHYYDWLPMTLDLHRAVELGPADPGSRAVVEYEMADPATSPQRLASLVTFPSPSVRSTVLKHPNCPDFVKAIAALGR